MSDVTTINRLCCVIQKIEFAKLNYTTAQNVGISVAYITRCKSNSWGKTCSEITKLNSTGELIVPAETIILSAGNIETI